MPVDIIELVKNGMEITLWLTLPPLLVSMIIGLLVSIFQAITQIQDQSLQFVPKLILVFVVMFFTFQFNYTKMADYAKNNFEIISNIKQQSHEKIENLVHTDQ